MVLFSLHFFVNSQAPYFLDDLEIRTENTYETRISNGIVYRDADQAIETNFNVITVTEGATIEERATNFITSTWVDYKHAQSFVKVLKLASVYDLPSSSVLKFQQYYHEIPVMDAFLKVEINASNQVTFLRNLTWPINNDITTTPEVDELTAKANALNHLGLNENLEHANAELVIKMINLKPVLCWKLVIVPIDKGSDWHVYVNAQDGSLMEAKDRVCHAHGTATVHSPSPTFSSKNYYRGYYVDGDDWNTPTLEAELRKVTLLDIEENNGVYKLNGPYATIDEAGSNGDYTNSSSDFSSTRDEVKFEAAMCYYYIDKTMRYVNEKLGFSVIPTMNNGTIKFNPRSAQGSGYVHTEGSVRFEAPGGIVDDGEDAFWIYHEVSHAIQHIMSGDVIDEAQGLGEGIADYWGASESRLCGDVNIWREWNPFYDTIPVWGGMPGFKSIRTTNVHLEYVGVDEPYPVHDGGQYISKPLMKIYNDIGKVKTDELVLASIPRFDNDLKLREAAEIIYDKAVDLGYSKSNLCIIYNHLDDVLGISDLGVQAPSGGGADIYIRDDQCDHGLEPAVDGPTTQCCVGGWSSEDIWVVPYDLPDWTEHTNPEYNALIPAWVHVRIRGNSCTSVSDAKLRLYYSKTSTAQVWPTMWNNYYINGVLSGDEITTQPIDIPTIAPGEEKVIRVEWSPPNPNFFGAPNQKFTLLARIDSSSQDPMNITETTSTRLNVLNNNNVAMKNIVIFDNIPGVNGPISTNVACGSTYQGGKIRISTPQNSLNKSVLELGNVFLKLNPALFTEWNHNTENGDGFQLIEGTTIKVLNDSFFLSGLPFDDCNDYIEIYFEPFNEEKSAYFDIVQTDANDDYVGGIRLEYRAPSNTTEQRKLKTASVPELNVFPNPVADLLNINLTNKDRCHSIAIYDLYGNLRYQYSLRNNQNTICTHSLNISEYEPGIYIIMVSDGQNGVIQCKKIIKI